MVSNYIKVTYRNFKKNKIYTFINIFGLAIGMAACFLILVYVYFEISFDRFHKNIDNIYLINLGSNPVGKSDGNTALRNKTPGRLAPALESEFPEILHSVRISNAEHPVFKHSQKIMISYKNQCFYAENVLFADPSIFEIFTLPMIAGNPQTALVAPYTMIITEAMAIKYFGDENPIGQTVVYNNQFNNYDFTITGVVKNLPHNSTLRFNFLCSMACVDEVVGYDPPATTHWEYGAFFSYILVKNDFSSTEFQQKLSGFMQKYPGFEASGSKIQLFLQPFKKIHLFSLSTNGLIPNTTLKFLFLLAAIALFILIIACINYINLTTARAASRFKEVGTRKILGAKKRQLIRQFLGESIFLSFVALCVAGMIIEILIPFFQSLIDKTIEIHHYDSVPILILFVILTLFIGFVAGSYPAFFLSSFQPVHIVKKPNKTDPTHFFLRKVLIVFQFVISIVLIVITISFFQQIEYMKNRQFGNQENTVVVIPLHGSWFDKNNEILKKEILQHPDVIYAAASSAFPGEQLGNFGLSFWWEGCGEKDERVLKPLDNPCNLPFLGVDYDFINTFGLKLIAGRNFSENISSDEKRAYILNETAIRHIGWKDSPIGKIFHSMWAEKKPGTIIGVIKDFHFKPVNEKIEPLVLFIGGAKYLSINIQSQNIEGTLKFIESCWKKFIPSRPFEFFFLDEYFDKLFKSELILMRLFTSASILAIFIACLGLLGMVFSTTELRIKEIGILKVLGASVSQIVFLISKDLIKCVIIANLVAWPIALFAINKWLQNFAYRIEIGWWTFALSGILALIIAFITISWQTIRAAMGNPVVSLRYE